MLTTGNQTGNVCHIYHEVCIYALCDFCECREINRSGISAGTGENQLRVQLVCLLLQVFHIDESVFIYVVEMYIVQLAAEVYRGSVSQVTAVVQVQGKNGVSRFQNSLVRCKVCLRSTVRLYVYVVVGIKYLSPHVAAVFFQLINVTGSAVISALVSGMSFNRLCRITFRILPGEAASACSQYRFRAVVLRSNQLYVVLLTIVFLLNQICNSRGGLADFRNVLLIISARIVSVSVKHFLPSFRLIQYSHISN